MFLWPFFKRRRRERSIARVFLPAAGKQVVIPFKSFSLIIIFLLLLLNAYFFLRSDIFLVKNLDFAFEELADEALVRQKIAEQVLARSIIFLDTTEVASTILAEFPTVREVSIARQIPDRLKITVSVRQPLAIVEDERGGRYLIDKEGLFFREAGQEKIPVVKLPEGVVGEIGKVVSEQSVLSYLRTLELVAEKGFKAQGLYLHPSSIELRLVKTKVWLSAETDIEYQLEVLSQILKRYKVSGQTPRSVDLRFARPVVRL
ncbi:MAG: hypothetical protein UY40_C0012G0007 [candidate division CPR1 bacterium GW2011_GWC1_49_13]|uniref:Uncharacterized protein n=1 Tax=candidate division CPR1 bacterium GW2011_GWC1_49_13 TaxID=1618342 RepID=A0A0G1VHF5_9BACT|nr:MAG: hypothetical protein UY40_C0012G0007 [candidate division CPR1 bacterium GW2011_GWC1_49_13]